MFTPEQSKMINEILAEHNEPQFLIERSRLQQKIKAYEKQQEKLQRPSTQVKPVHTKTKRIVSYEEQTSSDTFNTFRHEILPELMQIAIDTMLNRKQADLMVKQIGYKVSNEYRPNMPIENAVLARVELLIDDCYHDEQRKKYLQTIYNKIFEHDQLTIDSIILGFWLGNHC